MMVKVWGGVQGYDDDGKMGKAYPNWVVHCGWPTASHCIPLHPKPSQAQEPSKAQRSRCFAVPSRCGPVAVPLRCGKAFMNSQVAQVAKAGQRNIFELTKKSNYRKTIENEYVYDIDDIVVHHIYIYIHMS